MERVNIAELLEGCPSGLELDCTVYDECKLDSILEDKPYPIKVRTPEGAMLLTKYGSLSCSEHSKCVIFPKGKTTWEGFHRPFKPGDIVITDNNEHAFIYSGENDSCWECYCGVYCGTRNVHVNSKQWSNKIHELRLATEEEKEKLFQVIKDNGYKWNPYTKTLEKLIEPKFKVGDRIIKNDETYIFNVVLVSSEYYTIQGFGGVYEIPIKEQDGFKLTKNKFDITTLKPFESRVLVRDYNNDKWRVSFWGGLIDSKYGFKHDTIRGSYKQCIPYEGNEYLLGKTDNCNDYYKTW